MMRWLKDKKKGDKKFGGQDDDEDDYGFEKEKAYQQSQAQPPPPPTPSLSSASASTSAQNTAIPPSNKSPLIKRELPPTPAAPEEKSTHIYEEITDLHVHVGCGASSGRKPSSSQKKRGKSKQNGSGNNSKNCNTRNNNANSSATLYTGIKTTSNNFRNGGNPGNNNHSSYTLNSTTSMLSAGSKVGASAISLDDSISPYMVVPVDEEVRQTPPHFNRNGTPEVHCDLIVKDTHCEMLVTRKPKVRAFRLDSTTSSSSALNGAGSESYFGSASGGGGPQSKIIRNNTHFCSWNRRASVDVQSVGSSQQKSGWNSSTAFSSSSTSRVNSVGTVSSMSLSTLPESNNRAHNHISMPNNQHIQSQNFNHSNRQPQQQQLRSDNYNLDSNANIPANAISPPDADTGSNGSSTKGVMTYSTASNFIPRSTKLVFKPLTPLDPEMFDDGDDIDMSLMGPDAVFLSQFHPSQNQNSVSLKNNVSVPNNNNDNDDDDAASIAYASVQNQNQNNLKSSDHHSVVYSSIQNDPNQNDGYGVNRNANSSKSPQQQPRLLHNSCAGSQTISYSQSHHLSSSGTQCLPASPPSFKDIQNCQKLSDAVIGGGGGFRSSLIRPYSPSSSSSCTYASVNFPPESCLYNTIQSDNMSAQISPDSRLAASEIMPSSISAGGDKQKQYSSADVDNYGDNICKGVDGSACHLRNYNDQDLGKVKESSTLLYQGNKYGHKSSHPTFTQNVQYSEIGGTYEPFDQTTQMDANIYSGVVSVNGDEIDNESMYACIDANTSDGSLPNLPNLAPATQNTTSDDLLRTKLDGRLVLDFCTCQNHQQHRQQYSTCGCLEMKDEDDNISIATTINELKASSCGGCGRLIKQITYSESYSDETYEHTYSSRLLLKRGRRYSSPDITVSEISSSESQDMRVKDVNPYGSRSRDDMWPSINHHHHHHHQKSDNFTSSSFYCSEQDLTSSSSNAGQFHHPPTLRHHHQRSVSDVHDKPQSGIGLHSHSGTASNDCDVKQEVSVHPHAHLSHRKSVCTLMTKDRDSENDSLKKILSMGSHNKRASLPLNQMVSSSSSFSVSAKVHSAMCDSNSQATDDKPSAVAQLQPKSSAFSGLFSMFSRSKLKGKNASKSNADESVSNVEASNSKSLTNNKIITDQFKGNLICQGLFQDNNLTPTSTSTTSDILGNSANLSSLSPASNANSNSIPEKNTMKLSKYFQRLSMREASLPSASAATAGITGGAVLLVDESTTDSDCINTQNFSSSIAPAPWEWKYSTNLQVNLDSAHGGNTTAPLLDASHNMDSSKLYSMNQQYPGVLSRKTVSDMIYPPIESSPTTMMAVDPSNKNKIDVGDNHPSSSLGQCALKSRSTRLQIVSNDQHKSMHPISNANSSTTEGFSSKTAKTGKENIQQVRTDSETDHNGNSSISAAGGETADGKPGNKTDSGDTCYEYDISTSSESEHTNYDDILSKMKKSLNLEKEVQHIADMNALRKRLLCKSCKKGAGLSMSIENQCEMCGMDDACGHVSADLKYADWHKFFGEMIVDQRAAILDCLTDFTHSPYTIKGEESLDGNHLCQECGGEIVNSDSESLTTVYSILSHHLRMTSPGGGAGGGGGHTPSCDSDEGTMADNSDDSGDNAGDNGDEDDDGICVGLDENDNGSSGFDDDGNENVVGSSNKKKKSRHTSAANSEVYHHHHHRMSRSGSNRSKKREKSSNNSNKEKRDSSKKISHHHHHHHHSQSSSLDQPTRRKSKSLLATNEILDHEQLQQLQRTGTSSGNKGVGSNPASSLDNNDEKEEDESKNYSSSIIGHRNLSSLGLKSSIYGRNHSSSSPSQSNHILGASCSVDNILSASATYSCGVSPSLSPSKTADLDLYKDVNGNTHASKTTSLQASDRAIQDIYAPLPSKAVSLLTARHVHGRDRNQCACNRSPLTSSPGSAMTSSSQELDPVNHEANSAKNKNLETAEIDNGVEGSTANKNINIGGKGSRLVKISIKKLTSSSTTTTTAASTTASAANAEADDKSSSVSDGQKYSIDDQNQKQEIVQGMKKKSSDKNDNDSKCDSDTYYAQKPKSVSSDYTSNLNIGRRRSRHLSLATLDLLPETAFGSDDIPDEKLNAYDKSNNFENNGKAFSSSAIGKTTAILKVSAASSTLKPMPRRSSSSTITTVSVAPQTSSIRSDVRESSRVISVDLEAADSLLKPSSSFSAISSKTAGNSVPNLPNEATVDSSTTKIIASTSTDSSKLTALVPTSSSSSSSEHTRSRLVERMTRLFEGNNAAASSSSSALSTVKETVSKAAKMNVSESSLSKLCQPSDSPKAKRLEISESPKTKSKRLVKDSSPSMRTKSSTKSHYSRGEKESMISSKPPKSLPRAEGVDGSSNDHAKIGNRYGGARLKVKDKSYSKKSSSDYSTVNYNSSSSSSSSSSNSSVSSTSRSRRKSAVGSHGGKQKRLSKKTSQHAGKKVKTPRSDERRKRRREGGSNSGGKMEKTYYCLSSDISDIDLVEVDDWEMYSSSAAQQNNLSTSESVSNHRRSNSDDHRANNALSHASGSSKEHSSYRRRERSATRSRDTAPISGKHKRSMSYDTTRRRRSTSSSATAHLREISTEVEDTDECKNDELVKEVYSMPPNSSDVCEVKVKGHREGGGSHGPSPVASPEQVPKHSKKKSKRTDIYKSKKSNNWLLSDLIFRNYDRQVFGNV